MKLPNKSLTILSLATALLFGRANAGAADDMTIREITKEFNVPQGKYVLVDTNAAYSDAPAHVSTTIERTAGNSDGVLTSKEEEKFIKQLTGQSKEEFDFSEQYSFFALVEGTKTKNPTNNPVDYNLLGDRNIYTCEDEAIHAIGMMEEVWEPELRGKLSFIEIHTPDFEVDAYFKRKGKSFSRKGIKFEKTNVVKAQLDAEIKAEGFEVPLSTFDELKEIQRRVDQYDELPDVDEDSFFAEEKTTLNKIITRCDKFSEDSAYKELAKAFERKSHRQVIEGFSKILNMYTANGQLRKAAAYMHEIKQVFTDIGQEDEYNKIINPPKLVEKIMQLAATYGPEVISPMDPEELEKYNTVMNSLRVDGRKADFYELGDIQVMEPVLGPPPTFRLVGERLFCVNYPGSFNTEKGGMTMAEFTSFVYDAAITVQEEKEYREQKKLQERLELEQKYNNIFAVVSAAFYGPGRTKENAAAGSIFERNKRLYQEGNEAKIGDVLWPPSKLAEVEAIINRKATGISEIPNDLLVKEILLLNEAYLTRNKR